MDFILAEGIEHILNFGIQLAAETAIKRVAEVLDRSLSGLLKKSEIKETNDETGPEEEMKIDILPKNKEYFERVATDEEVNDPKESPHIKVTDYISSGDNVDGHCTNDYLFVDAESTEDCLEGKASSSSDSIECLFPIAKEAAIVPEGYFREDPIEDELPPYLISPTYHEIARRYTGWDRKKSEATTDVVLAPYIISSTDPTAAPRYAESIGRSDIQEEHKSRKSAVHTAFRLADTKTMSGLFRNKRSKNIDGSSYGTYSLKFNLVTAKDRKLTFYQKVTAVPKGYIREDPIEDVLYSYLISPTYHKIARRYTGWNRKRCEITTDVALAPYLIRSTDPIAVPMPTFVDTPETRKSSLPNTFRLADTKTMAGLFRCERSENLVGSSSGSDSIECNLTIEKEAATLPKGYFRALSEDTSDEVLCFYFDKSVYPEAVHKLRLIHKSLTCVDAAEDLQFKEREPQTAFVLSDTNTSEVSGNFPVTD